MFLKMKDFITRNKIIILSILYIISPIDLMPIFLLGPVGLIDDLFVALVLLVYALIRLFASSKFNTELPEIEYTEKDKKSKFSFKNTQGTD